MLFSSGDNASPFDDAPRILLFTGKGGTGKTTCAAALARKEEDARGVVEGRRIVARRKKHYGVG
jgi:AAA+ superfamily predicted ATPase